MITPALADDRNLSRTTSLLTLSPLSFLTFSFQVGPDAKFADLGADSLDTVEIMMALEEKFEVTLDEDGAEGLATVQDAADLIVSKM